MKVLDVDVLQVGLKNNVSMLERLQKETESIHLSIKGLVGMNEILKGHGGNSIRAFYEECHLPFLEFFQLFSKEYKSVLETAESALLSLEPNTEGHMVESYMDGEVEEGLQNISTLTKNLVEATNGIMDQVADIVSLPHLDDSDVQDGIILSRNKKNDTLDKLYEFDYTQHNTLLPIENGIKIMERRVAEIEALMKSGLTDKHFQVNVWNLLTVNSELTDAIETQKYPQLSCVLKNEHEHLIGTEISAETFDLMNVKLERTVERELFGDFSLLNYHEYENGLVIKEYRLKGEDTIHYEIVGEVKEEILSPEEMNKLGPEELNAYFNSLTREEIELMFDKQIEAQEEENRKINQAILDFLILDDVNTLFGPDSSVADRGLAAAGFIPFGKVTKLGKLGKLFGHADDVPANKIDDVLEARGIKVVDGRVGNKIPIEEFQNIRSRSVHNVDADSMTLGRYTGGSDSYIARAGNNSTYFSMGDDWDKVQSKYGLSDQEMFDYFNVPALNDAVSSGKKIQFSHNPNERVGSFLNQEWEYLKKEHGFTDLIEEGGMWYAER
ncbi:LXG domain-containing protein [Psychrobacillus sp. MER TA 171]|uniref:LXG domain-containing protein n=1 Tax=Psychrobacillus sp. MER TA 171 TaxID=2939577 RepID=UPI00203ECA98|nr:LXG domain-containing protein [Psychrobacillus sp. MER TA 171]MCM3359397.1 LXG domain-containing protein [Psychrobacillus sp. MER TA 171]